MKSKEEWIDAWCEKAESDYHGFIILTHSEPLLYDLAFFHAQQAVEKWLKAVMIKYNLSPPKTHDLLLLIDLLVDVYPVLDTPEWYAKGQTLLGLAIEVRYPNDVVPKENLADKLTVVVEDLEAFKVLLNKELNKNFI